MKDTFLTREVSPHPHARIIVYWLLILLALFILRYDIGESAITVIRGDKATSPVVPFLKADEEKVVVKQSKVKRSNKVQLVHLTTSVVELNKASVKELCILKGIGPVLAKRIITYRDEHGLFSSVEDLVNVKGIGPKTVLKLKSQAVSVSR